MSDPELITRLEDADFLRLMRPDVRRIILASFAPVEAGFGTVLLRQGEPTDGLYVLLEGHVRVVTEAEDGSEVTLATLGPGDTFGEIGLLTGRPASATVRARSPVRAARLDQTVVRALIAEDDRIRHDFELRSRQLLLKTFLQRRTPLGGLPDDALSDLLAALEPMTVPAGRVVVTEGDPAGPLFVVDHGRLRVHTRDGDAAGPARDLAFLRRGDVFGERALLLGEPRSATVEASSDSRLLRLSPDTYQQLLDIHPAFRLGVEEVVATYRHRRPERIPLDFAEVIEVEALTPLSADPSPRPQRDDRLEPSAWPEIADGTSPDPDRAADTWTRRRRRLPLVLQVDEADCGAACVAMLVRHFGRRVSIARVREATNTTIEGTSMRGIARGAEALGLRARSVKASTHRLGALPLPAVFHDDGDHWVVVTRVTDRHVRFTDPALGRRRLPRREFEERWSGYAVLVSPTDRLQEVPETAHPARWLLPLVRPHWRRFVAAAALALLVAGLEMLVPVFTQRVVDEVIPAADVRQLRVIVLALGGVLLALAAGSYANRYLLSRAAVDIDGDALDHVAARMFALPLRYFQLRRIGDIQRRLAGLRQVRAFAVANGVVALTAVTQLVAAVTLMAVYSDVLTLVFLAAVPAYAGLMAFALARIRPLAANLEEAFGRYHSDQLDALRGIETVKAMGAEASLRRRLTRDFRGLAHRQHHHDLTAMTYETGVRVISLASLGLFLWAGALQVIDGALTIGEFVAFNTLVALAITPIRILLLLWDDAQLSSVLLNRLHDIVGQEPEQAEDGLRPVPTLAGDVRLSRVTFRYGDPDSPPILHDVSLHVPAGTTVAIVGRSGSGKTTLVRCLAGLLRPTEGQVLFDGIDATVLDLRELRRHIGFLPQDTWVFADTIAANIAFGDDEPDQERIRWAAGVANAHEFITDLPLGYETKVGETGLQLSGGQRQRIAIARAAHRRPAILVLDEATSNLDAESERIVQSNLDRLLDTPTSIIVAHRLSTIRHADLIVVLEKGRLVEQGTHAELLDRGGLYAHLTAQQLDL